MKGLRGSLFGLLHRGEGEEGRMRRKESKADLRAQVLVDNAAGRGASIDLRRKKSFAYGEGQQDDLSPPLPSPISHIAAPSPSPSNRPHLRRSSNSAPNDVPQTRLFSPITLHKAYGPSSYKMDKDMPASDSIESLTSPPQRSNSTFAKTSSPRQGLGDTSTGAGPMTRKLRSGSDTAAWERKERAAFPNRPRQDLAERDTTLKSSIQSTVPPTIPARNLADVFSAPPPVQTNLIPPTVLKHRPRSQSWSASNCLDGANFEVPPIKGLRLQKKRSEPILNAKFTEVQPGHPSIPSRTTAGSLGSSLQPVEPLHLRKNESTNRDSQAETRPSLLAYLENRYSRDSNSSSSHLSSTLTNPYDPRLIDNDIYISPTRTVLEDQEAAMKALEDALNGPRSGGTAVGAGASSGWPVVDFGFDETDHPSASVTPRPISPKHKVGDSPQLEKYIDVERGQGNEAKPNRAGSVSGLNRTPPREPLPRLPVTRTALSSSNRQTLNSLGLPLPPPSHHQILPGSLKKQLVLQEAHQMDPASTLSQSESELDPSLQLPRLSYSYSKPRSSGRSDSKHHSSSRDSRGSTGRPSLRGLGSLKVEPYSQTNRDSRYTEEDGARQPRLVEVVFPRSAPAARSEFPRDQDIGGYASGQGDSGVGASGEGEEGETELGRMKMMWEREKAGKRRLEDELMVLQGKHLGAVSRIARLEQENEQLRRRVSEGVSLPSLPSFGSSTSTTSTMMLLMTPEKDRDRTPGREQQQQDQQKQKEMHSRYGSMDTIDRLEVDLGSPFAKRRES
ncbi:hypothetical protein HD553DRAFT_306839 [Filobasidium floriforme]|uniref:uncharacterized protein n=1 Tax=Filobasidium floriforme TaxID=5210 RepID=UPI001E8CEC05|nr:uncharacterized protein HD553DRAFT_306839 [Filobasidium floriforme]KAH8087905.1 hypothetical protein HD553DRAFT_306839 [Filobasidium floriforme]